jgi:hypothetical protein
MKHDRKSTTSHYLSATPSLRKTEFEDILQFLIFLFAGRGPGRRKKRE